MRIAFITPEFVTNAYFSGRLANYVHRVSRVLAEMGHDVHVIILAERVSGGVTAGSVRSDDMTILLLLFYQK